MFISFLKEFLFDKSEELDITNVNFNFKKMIYFIILLLSLFLNALLIDKIISLGNKYFTQEKEIKKLNEYKSKVDVAEDNVVTCNKVIFDLVTKLNNYDNKCKKH